MAKMLFNDQIMERENVVNIEDRGYQFGDGVYEVIGVYDGKPFMMDEHLVRLQRSANEIQLNFPYQMDEFKKSLEKLVVANELHEGIIYLQVSRGAGPRWHEFPDSDVPPVTVAYTRAENRMTDLEEKGGAAVLTEDIRWLRCDIKTLNLLPNVLAKQKAVENNAVEAILHRDDIVTEASASNVFIVKDGQLYTHPANNYILNGITRKKILELCDSLNIKVNEETFTVDEMLAADEVFVSATKSDIIPILQIDNHKIGAGVPGATTLRILEEFRSLIRELAKT
ncbi:D-amino-acid transaminase [Virgibacillus sp. NKC19-16]|uniref:D-amino-acid transaminase n=1 Tax=Virgibacillus salidurans TaxID=2831673 RepID=UPI001F316D67|nr:D-amino-acid transaminase [Virgibacillus sp. NKC19-16]UJL47476.1 D-amino-acid transaminase [Virgibacillus sp. NKC19-16]